MGGGGNNQFQPVQTSPIGNLVQLNPTNSNMMQQQQGQGRIKGSGGKLEQGGNFTQGLGQLLDSLGGGGSNVATGQSPKMMMQKYQNQPISMPKTENAPYGSPAPIPEIGGPRNLPQQAQGAQGANQYSQVMERINAMEEQRKQWEEQFKRQQALRNIQTGPFAPTKGIMSQIGNIGWGNNKYGY